jgi:hypothetical protein
MERRARPAYAAPVVDRSRPDLAERGRGDGQPGEVREDLPQHLGVGRGVEIEEIGVDALEHVAQRGGIVLFVADHDIGVLEELPVDFGREYVSMLPQGCAEVEVIRDHGSVPPGGLHRLGGKFPGPGGQGTEHAAGVEPAGPADAEDLVPVDVSRLHLGRGRMPAVGAAERPSHAEAALGEVERVSGGPDDTVVFPPVQVCLLDAPLIFRPRATLYSPPPSDAEKFRVVATRPFPGSSRSMTSPRATRSYRHSCAGRNSRARRRCCG